MRRYLCCGASRRRAPSRYSRPARCALPGREFREHDILFSRTCRPAMQLDGCRINAEQYETLLETVPHDTVPGPTDAAPPDLPGDIVNRQSSCDSGDYSDEGDCRPQARASRVSFAGGRPMAEAQETKDRDTVIAVQSSLEAHNSTVEAHESSLENEMETLPALVTAPSPLGLAQVDTTPPVHSDLAGFRRGHAAKSKQGLRAAARHKRRLFMFSRGQASFGARGAGATQTSSQCKPVYIHSNSLTNSVSEEVLAAALKFNPLFSVMKAAEDSPLEQKDGEMPVRLSLVVSFI